MTTSLFRKNIMFDVGGMMIGNTDGGNLGVWLK